MFKGLPSLSVAVLGSGPRALASALCLSRHHTVKLGEPIAFRQQQRLARRPMYPGEPTLDELVRHSAPQLEFADSCQSALVRADLVVVAEQPIFRAPQRNFDLSAIERCLQAVARCRPQATVILEAPAPVGFALQASLRHRIEVIPAPLLLRQGRMVQDRAQPGRIVVGSESERGLNYAFMAVRSFSNPNTPYLLTNASEAEAIHAFERKRAVRGRSETREEVADYCRRHRLNEDQLLRGLQPIDYVYEAQCGEPAEQQRAPPLFGLVQRLAVQ